MFLKKVPYEGGITVGTDYLNANVLECFKKYGPVGTRDMHTKKILDKLAIPNYFSGCMTLTLNKFEGVKKEDYIVVVGLNDKEINYIKKKTKRKVIKFVQDVKKGSFSNESWDERKKRVEEVLKLYQGAHMVITTKLHCSLPCLALGTPILLLYDTSFAENKDRIGTFLPYLNYINRENFLTSDIDFDNPKQNSTKYLKLRKQLEERCIEFVKKSHNIDEPLLEVADYEKYLIKSRNMRVLPIRLVSTLQRTYEKECKKSAKMHDQVDELNHLKKEYDKLLEEYRLLDAKLNKTIEFRIKRVIRKIKQLISKNGSIKD